MRILFISSGNSEQGISPIVINQGQSLIENGVSVDYLTIKGKGFRGYLKFIPKIRKHLKQNKYDIVHAHYSLSAFAASLAGAKPLVVSLMGSDLKANKRFKYIIWVFYKLYWKATIVKSLDMSLGFGFVPLEIIPNGVNLKRFRPLEKKKCQVQLNWDTSKIHVLFPSNPNRKEKNYKLLKEALKKIENNDIKIKVLTNVPNIDVPVYMNAANIVVLLSLWEGSPNAIKEAMACNIPIVSTNVGDVKEVLGKTEGCYITNFAPEDVLDKIKKALEFNKKTTGRNRIKELCLDSEATADKIIEIYKKVLK